MGVMGCFRNGCTRIMCDRLSQEHGYICDECFDELVASGPTTDVSEFMESERKAGNNREEAEARYEIVFPHKRDAKDEWDDG